MKLKDKILSKIQKEKIVPLSETYFRNKYRILWGFLWISILLGFIGVAFLIEDSDELMGMFHYSRWDFWIFLLPNIFWLILILFLIFIGIKSLRNTQVGYRYPYWKTIFIWIIIILSWGYLFRLSWFWPRIHTFLVANIPWVTALIYNEAAWNSPENRRLAGTIIEKTNIFIKIKSIDESIWNIDITTAFVSPKVIWTIGEKVRILWRKNWDSSFLSEKIMPWFGQWMGNWWAYGKGNTNRR